MVKTILKIDGMKCGMCEAHINNLIRSNFKIKKVSSSHKKNETFIITNEVIKEKTLIEVIENAGYKIYDVSYENYQRKNLFSFLKKQK